MKKPCSTCNTIHPSDAARAYGIFSGNTFYKAAVPGASHHATRTAAEADYCAHYQRRRTI